MNQISEGQLFVNRYSHNKVVFLYSSSAFLVVEEVAEPLEGNCSGSGEDG